MRPYLGLDHHRGYMFAEDGAARILALFNRGEYPLVADTFPPRFREQPYAFNPTHTLRSYVCPIEYCAASTPME